MKKSLTGQWLLRAADEDGYLQAEVPGCQYLDLLRARVIPDPFVGTNERDVQWVHDKDYLYQKHFAVEAADLEADHVRLVATQLDTLAEVSLNGRPVGVAANCHRTYTFDVKPYLTLGDNVLSILFRSPKRYVEERYRACPTPPNSNGQNGIVHIRKPQCHFGWDWGPVLIPVGIGGDIYLDVVRGPILGTPEVRTRKTEAGFAVSARADGAQTLRLTCPDGRSYEVEGDSAEWQIDDPMLWWTRELSQKDVQPLYTVCALRREPEAASRSVRIGLRTIELNRTKDQYGYNFQFVLNGVPLFIKGANYIPPDSFITRHTAAQRKALLDACQAANLNMIRVWGGGYYADDALLDECDERGILVWQDFMFACQAYPFFDDDFCQNVLAEVADNVRRISTHPALALWCGNNEIEAMHLAWAAMRRYVEWTEKFFYHVLPDALAALDPDTPYVPGSPVGSAHNKDVDADHVGDTHLWGVWHGLQPMQHYRKRMTRFCSEFGFESLPSMDTIRSYARPEDYPLDSAVQRAHQKCVGGNDKMLYYVAKRFHLSTDVEDLVYLSQITQATCIADATEHWRRHKGRCNGAMYWQLNDCWPTCSWSSYDYRGNYKALHYQAKHFNAPLSVSIEDTPDKVRVHVLNDLTTAQTVEVECLTFDFANTHPARMHDTVTVPAQVGVVVYEMDAADIDPRRQGFAVRLSQNGVVLMQKTLLLLPEKRLDLPKCNVEVQEEVVDGVRRISLSSPAYQRLVMLSNGGLPFSDNYFDLLPGQSKVVTQPVSPEDEALCIRTVATCGRAPLGSTLKAKCKVFLSASNIANALYHRRIPKPYHGK